MNDIIRRPLFNPDGDTELRKRRMIGGNTTNLNDFNNMKYGWVSDWYRQAMNNFWIPEEINLNQDCKDYPRLDIHERTAYDKILSFLIFLDSIQTANLPNVGEYITANEVNLCLSIQTFQESIHSQSYSYMLDTICSPDQRNDILYQWKTDEHLLKRNTFIGGCYTDFQVNRDRFHFITHLWLFRNIILELKKEDPELFEPQYVEAYRNLMLEGVRQEIAWGQYVIGDNIAGLTSKMIEDYIKYLGNLRWTALEFAPLYSGYTDEPPDMAWVSSYANANMVKTDFFEARSTAYAKSTALVDDL